jgi:hypothetical protein
MTRHSVAALLEHIKQNFGGHRFSDESYAMPLTKMGPHLIAAALADAIERERGTTTNDVLTDAGLVVGPTPGAGAAAPESPNVEVGPYRAVLDTLVGASDMKLSEALAGTFLLLDHAAPHITIPTEAMVTILRAVRAAVVLQERAALRGERSTPTEQPNTWRCFHCDETFTDREAASLHFGNDEIRHSMGEHIEAAAAPACQIKARDGGLLAALRHAEGEIINLHAQVTNAEHEAEHFASLPQQIARYFKGARSPWEAFCLLDSMEGRALAAEEKLSRGERSTTLSDKALARYDAAREHVRDCGPALERATPEPVKRLIVEADWLRDTLVGSPAPTQKEK